MPRFSTRDGLGALAFFLVSAAVALTGGGWLALERADPALAIPGAGWAAFALILVVPQASPARLAVLALSGAVVLTMLAWTVADGGVGLSQVALLLLGSGVTAALLGWALQRVRGGRALSVARYIIGIVVAVMMANAMPRLIAPLYAVPVAAERTSIILVSSLPLTAPAGDISGVIGSRAPPQSALTWLDRRYAVDRRDVVTPEILASGAVLVLAHPSALPPEALVAIDDRLRRGGSALILADGLSSWPPPYPLGDARNPPITSLLTPLLNHWGLTLDAPAGLAASPVVARAGPHRLRLFSAGTLRQAPAADVECRVQPDGYVAHCAVGRGRALVIADADWLAAAQWGTAQTEAYAWRSGNMLWLAEQIDRLSGHAPPAQAMLTPVWADWPLGQGLPRAGGAIGAPE